MDEEIKGRVSSLLSEASRLLFSPNSTNTAANTNSVANFADSATASNSSASTTQRTLQDTLRRAQGMLRESSSSGLCRRLNRHERLRAVAGPYQRDKPAKVKAKKAMEFALLRCLEVDGLEEVRHLKWDSIIANGILMWEEGDDENTIRNAIKESLEAKFPLLGTNDFDFVKVRQKAVSTLQLGPGTEYNYAVVKKMAGQGLLYVKVKQGYEFVYNGEMESDDELLKSAFGSTCDPKPANHELPGTANASSTDASSAIFIEEEVKPDGEECSEVPNGDTAAVYEAVEGEIQSCDVLQNQPDQHLLEATSGCTSADPVPTAKQLVSEIHNQGLNDPVEILRFLHKKLIRGRDLDVTSQSEVQEGNTNYICIDRLDILNTTFAELACIENFTITFEVDFMGEKAKDLGGPRKEWIRLMNAAIKIKYFDNGLREFLSDDYYYVGIMLGIALLQNGQLPTFMPVDVIEKLAKSSRESCIANIQRGLDVFGLAEVIQEVPILLHLLRPGNHKLVARMVLNLLAPEFSQEGSTAIVKEKKVYALFVKYVRQVASGRREPITLSSILVFVTGAAEEPVLGFALHPSITFVSEEPKVGESSEHIPYEYLPTAHTCSNVLVLPIGSLTSPPPEEDSLFQVYDLAFATTHFGTV